MWKLKSDRPWDDDGECPTITHWLWGTKTWNP